jgi:sugar phosphate isomerase/epimerase
LEEFDKYKGTELLMPYAKGVSAKSHVFDAEGNERNIDYYKIMKIVKDAGFSGYVGIEFEGSELSPEDGIRATKKLLEKVGKELS